VPARAATKFKDAANARSMLAELACDVVGLTLVILVGVKQIIIVTVLRKDLTHDIVLAPETVSQIEVKRAIARFHRFRRVASFVLS
jgi:hypothetical protein